MLRVSLKKFTVTDVPSIRKPIITLSFSKYMWLYGLRKWYGPLEEVFIIWVRVTSGGGRVLDRRTIKSKKLVLPTILTQNVESWIQTRKSGFSKLLMKLRFTKQFYEKNGGNGLFPVDSNPRRTVDHSCVFLPLVTLPIFNWDDVFTGLRKGLPGRGFPKCGRMVEWWQVVYIVHSQTVTLGVK